MFPLSFSSLISTSQIMISWVIWSSGKVTALLGSGSQSCITIHTGFSLNHALTSLRGSSRIICGENLEGEVKYLLLLVDFYSEKRTCRALPLYVNIKGLVLVVKCLIRVITRNVQWRTLIRHWILSSKNLLVSKVPFL